MSIERYQHKKHGLVVRSWLASRGIPMPAEELLFDTGFIVDWKAVGFLCKTNSKTAYIDQVATRPGLPTVEKEQLLSKLFERLEMEARRCGFKHLLALAGSKNMGLRFIKRGFFPAGSYTLVLKELNLNKEVLQCLG